MKKFILMLVVCICTLQNSYASERFRELTFDIKENMSIKQNSKDVEIESPNIYIKIKGYDFDDFDAGKVMNKLDTMMFNLKSYKLVEEKKEPFYALDKDYIKKYYEDDKGGKVITYTCYGDIPYVLIGLYNSNDDLAEVMSVIESIDVNVSWWDSIWLTLKNSYYMWIIIFLVLVFIRMVKVYLAMIAGVVIALIAFWGNWPLAITYAVILALIALIAHPKVLEAFGD